MKPMDMTMIVKYKVSSFLYLHNDFGCNSLCSTCTCQSLIVDTDVKLNFRFVGRPIVNHCEGHNSVIRSAIEVHELLMESLFDKISNRSGPTSISHRQGLQIIKTFCHWSTPKLEHPQRRWETHQGVPWTSSTLVSTLGDQQRRPSRVGGPIRVKFEYVSNSRNSPH